jgi:aminobenzoyl-glutamate utilization protein B
MKIRTDIGEKMQRLTDGRQELLKQVSQRVWKLAEVSRHEFESAQFLVNQLKSLGFDVVQGVGGYPTSFIGEWNNGAKGPVVGLLCEYDALPGLSSEEEGKPGHGCGHNLFAGAAITTGDILKAYMEEEGIPGTIKVFGTPSEESYGSKPFLVKQGFFDGVDFFIGFHPLEFNGVLYATHNAMVTKKYRFHGKTSHAGAEPELGISALDAVEIMNVAVNYLREHVTQDARIHYIITHGGDAPNIVPGYAESLYVARAQDLSNLRSITEKIDNCAKGAALATGATCDIEIVESFANTVLNRPYCELGHQYIQYFGAPPYTESDQQSVAEFGKKEGLLTKIESLPETQGAYGASTDEGDVSWVGPWARICMAVLADGTPGHSVEVTQQSNMSFAFKGMLHNVKVWASTLGHLMTVEEDLRRVKDYHQEAMKNRQYDRSFNAIPDPKFFPNSPGFEIIAFDRIQVEVKKNPFLREQQKGQIYFTQKGNRIGEKNLEQQDETISVVLKKEIEEKQPIYIYYQNQTDQQETFLGYLHK